MINNIYDKILNTDVKTLDDALDETRTIKTVSECIDEWISDNILPTMQNFKFRAYQKEAIVSIIERIIESKEVDPELRQYETQIIEAPTGSGKSIICIVSAGVLSKYYNISSYILCSDLYLWQQYADFIDNNNLPFGKLKGLTGNYRCDVNGLDVRAGACKLEKISYAKLKDPEFCRNNGYECAFTCNYMQSRFKAAKSKVTLMTYQLWLFQMNLVAKNSEAPDFDSRDVIFCDECHKIPGIIQSFCSPLISPTDDFPIYCEIIREAKNAKLGNFADLDIESLDPLKLYNTLTDLFKKMTNEDDKETLFELLNKYVSELVALKPITEAAYDKAKNCKTYGKEIPENLIRLISKCDHYANLMCYLSDYIDAVNLCGIDYIIKKDVLTGEFGQRKRCISFSCAKEDLMTSNYLLANASFKVMLSATPGEKLSFDDNIGIKFSKSKCSELIKIPSTFNFEESPIYFVNKYRMSYNFIETSIGPISEMMWNILRAYNDKKGIIHTGSYKLAKRFAESAPHDIRKRLLCYADSKMKDAHIRDLQNSTNKVLIGPTLTEGVDLPDENCRFIIIAKIPYPNTTDEIVQMKMKLFPRWYDSETSNSVIQAIGRGVRNENDWCHSYILDACFGSLLQKTPTQYSMDFKNRLQLIM